MTVASMLLQVANQATEHQASDSVSGLAISRALSAAGIVNWKIVTTVFILAFMVGAGVLLVMELNTIRKAGGLKKWVDDVPIVQYRTVRLIWLSEASVVVLTLAVVAHAVWPQVIGEIQTDMVYAIFAFLGFGQGMNVTAFIGKRATEDPVITATNAALNDPTIQPIVTSNKRTGERTVTMMPTTPSLANTQTMQAPVVAASTETVTTSTFERPLPRPAVITRDD